MGHTYDGKGNGRRIRSALAIWLIGTGWCNRVSYGVMAAAFGVTRSAIAGVVNYYVRSGRWHLRADERKSPVVHHRYGPSGEPQRPPRRGYWDDTDARIFEPYAKRKLRRLNRPPA